MEKCFFCIRKHGTNFFHPIFSSIKVMEFLIFLFISHTPNPLQHTVTWKALSYFHKYSFWHRRNLLNFIRFLFSFSLTRLRVRALKSFYLENAVRRKKKKAFHHDSARMSRVDVDVDEILRVIPCCKKGVRISIVMGCLESIFSKDLKRDEFIQLCNLCKKLLSYRIFYF